MSVLLTWCIHNIYLQMSKSKKPRLDPAERQGADSPGQDSESSYASCQSSSSLYYSDSSLGLGPSESPDSEYIQCLCLLS